MSKNLVEHVHICSITLKPEKYRHFELDLDGIEKLTEDIREKGLLVPILLWRQKNEDILISGYHRIECAKRMEWETIPARIVFFESEVQALEASIQTNAQDQYTFAKRSWFERFKIAESVLRDIYERKAQLRQRRGKKVTKKYRVDELLARAVGLSWSYVKYAQMRKILTCIKEDNVDTSVVQCLCETTEPKIQLWLEILEMHKAQKIPEKQWNEFVEVCEEIAKNNNDELRATLDGHLKYLRGALRRKNVPSQEKIQNSATFLVTWTDEAAPQVLEQLKKICSNMKWTVQVDGKPKRDRDVFSQKITFITPEQER
ncbi:ParB/RepB/Spo0J family partition protein [Candidatus Uabimicrobium sp. HlEnr_7]|uniref:ParB/RepB/Spo0J family partition protein n=1 Tax=Candidatus Uabimicrobium helgolandensis TaxID=3095367 RepID=UPI0035567561